LRERGMLVWASQDDFEARARAEEDTAAIGPVDLVLFTVKTYQIARALSALPPLVGEETTVLTLQNGVDSPDELAAVVGERPVVGGSAYIAAELVAPGVIRQTGTHARIILGEVFGPRDVVSKRVRSIRSALDAAGIGGEAVPDGRVPLWEKLIYLSPFAGFTGAARLPIGPIWNQPAARAVFVEACAEVETLARAEGVPIASDMANRISEFTASLPPETRSSLLMDLAKHKPIEVEALQGAVVRRASVRGTAAPIHRTLYALLKPHEHGSGGTS
jgi:2-dehydropantoate 2-reductase